MKRFKRGGYGGEEKNGMLGWNNETVARGDGGVEGAGTDKMGKEIPKLGSLEEWTMSGGV